MVTLTVSEKQLFTAPQLVQVNRLSAGRKEQYLNPPDVEDPVAVRAKVLARFASYTPEELRARVNVTAVRWGREIVIDWAPESNYTDQEKEAIQQGLRQGDKFIYRVAAIIEGGPSLEQRVKVLERR